MFFAFIVNVIKDLQNVLFVCPSVVVYSFDCFCFEATDLKIAPGLIRKKEEEEKKNYFHKQ